MNDALDRFSSTFISPSFPKDKIKRELDSIQNEFESKCNDDILRCERIRKCVGNSKHVYAKFDYGNKSTLTNDDQLYKCLLEFYNEYYSSDNMGLAILGKGKNVDHNYGIDQSNNCARIIGSIGNDGCANV